MAMIDVVKFDGPAGVLVWKFPSDQLSWGARVIVNQSQEAIFFKGGEALDILGPGTHTLETSNIPLLRNLVNIPFGGKTPFAAEVYFVNKAAQLDGKWGTKAPIPLLDPKYNIPLPVRAFGRFGVRVADSRKLIVGLSGTVSQYTVETLTEHFRGLVMTKTKDYLAETVAHRKVGFLEITAFLEEISADLKEKLKDDFAGFGVELLNFLLESVTVPEDDPSVVRLKKVLSDKAEIDILGSDYKMKRTFDTMEKAAGTEGSVMGAGMGLGMGAAAGAQFGAVTGAAMGPAAAAACPACKAPAQPGAKFCAGCGAALGPKRCAKCSAESAPGARFCSSCGSSL